MEQQTRVKAGSIVTGPLLPEAIEVLAVVPMGESLKVIGRGRKTGKTHDPVLSPDQLAQLDVSAEREPFDGDGRLFRLGIEAQRLGLAYEYDPFFSLSIARVDPLSMVDGLGTWSQPLSSLASKVANVAVADLVGRMDKREFIDANASLDEATNRLVAHRFLSLIVVEEKETIGVLRVVDVFAHVCERVTQLQ